ncbi:phospholipase A2 inhibitor and Ly6/PLAUR domain-containing protein-like [Clarias gariepinus]
MKSQVKLLLICMLFSKALSLTCHHCLPSQSKKCNNQTYCPDQCLTATTAVYLSGTKHIFYIKTCGTLKTCVSGRLNLGIIKVTTNAQCCTSDLCNSQTLSVHPQQALSGTMCYSGSGKVNCTGSEDRCIIASVQKGGNTMPMKGCVSSNFCHAHGSSSMPAFNISNMHCCEGNLCNGAESITLSFLLISFLLLSCILFC